MAEGTKEEAGLLTTLKDHDVKELNNGLGTGATVGIPEVLVGGTPHDDYQLIRVK